MKTLDEVIKAWSICFSDNSRSDCTGCPYADEDGDAACFNHDREDALYYLKAYRNLDSLDAVAFPEDDNPPLSWGELKQMKKKPVWVEADDGKYKRWFIVGNFFSWFEKEDFDAHVNLYSSGGAMEMSKEMFGSYWQAYRKERK